MPALFAYLIALGLLLGGGYGALNWLTAPEPLKLAARHHARPAPASPPYDAPLKPSASTEANADTPALAQNSSDPKPPRSDTDRPEETLRVPLAKAEQMSKAPESHQDQPQNNAVAKIPVEQPVHGALPPPPREARSAPSAGSNKTGRTGPRSTGKFAVSHQQPLALMTLRTIEFPDGRRQTQLVPYRGSPHVMAFEADE